MGIKRKLKKWLSFKLKNLLKEELPVLIKKTGNIDSGRETYHNGDFIVKGKGKLSIGSFCALGNNIKVILSNHNYNYASIQYTFYRTRFKNTPYGKENGKTFIGNDVWIGDNVLILPNVKIGNGVCIGAGSVITKDIPDYAIAVGVPAEVIKFRFTKKHIKELEKIKWWNWSNEKINKNRSFFFKSFTDN